MLGKENTWLCVRGKMFAAVFLHWKNCKLFPLFLFVVDYLLSTRQQQQLLEYENKKQEKVTTTQFGLLTLCCCSAASLTLPLCLTFLISLLVIVRFTLFSSFGVAFVAFCVAGRNGDAMNECILVHMYIHPFICCIWIYVYNYICICM